MKSNNYRTFFRLFSKCFYQIACIEFFFDEFNWFRPETEHFENNSHRSQHQNTSWIHGRWKNELEKIFHKTIIYVCCDRIYKTYSIDGVFENMSLSRSDFLKVVVFRLANRDFSFEKFWFRNWNHYQFISCKRFILPYLWNTGPNLVPPHQTLLFGFSVYGKRVILYAEFAYQGVKRLRWPFDKLMQAWMHIFENHN